MATGEPTDMRISATYGKGVWMERGVGNITNSRLSSTYLVQLVHTCLTLSGVLR